MQLTPSLVIRRWTPSKAGDSEVYVDVDGGDCRLITEAVDHETYVSTRIPLEEADR